MVMELDTKVLEWYFWDVSSEKFLVSLATSRQGNQLGLSNLNPKPLKPELKRS